VRVVFKFLAGLVFVAVIVQVGLAGIGAFHSVNKNDDGPLAKEKVSDWFGPHAGLGYLILLLTLLLMIVGFATRQPRWRNRAAALFGLLVLQVLLAWIGGGVWALGFLHPINALVIFTLSGLLAREAWTADTARAPVAEPAV